MSKGIVLDTTFDNPSLPIALTYGEQIKALSSLTDWFQSDRRSVTLASGKIASWADIKGGARKLEQATSSRRSTLTDAAVAGYSAADFNAVLASKYTLSGGVFDFNAPHSFAIVTKPATPAGPATLIGGFTSTSDKEVVITALGSSAFSYVRGTESLQLPFVAGEWGLLIVSWDGSKLRGEYNGVRDNDEASASVVTDHELLVGAPAPASSQCYLGQIADVLFFDTDVLAAEPDSAQLLRDYARYVYGVE